MRQQKELIYRHMTLEELSRKVKNNGLSWIWVPSSHAER